MISPKVEIVDVDPAQWRHLWDILLPAPGRRLVIVHEQGQVIKAFDTRLGLLSHLREQAVIDPQTLAATLHATYEPDETWVLELAGLKDFYAAIHALYTPTEDGDDYLRGVRLRLDEEPRLVRYPRQPQGLRLAGVPYESLLALLATVPDGGVVILGVFKENALWTSLILRFAGGQVDRITSSDALLPLHCPVSDWRETARALLALVEARIGPPYLGLFCEREAFLRLAKQSDKLATLAALVDEDAVIIAPCPSKVAAVIEEAVAAAARPGPTGKSETASSAVPMTIIRGDPS